MVLVVDRRIGGCTKYRLASSEGELMQVPEEVRKCVFFLALKTAKGDRLAGTGFFFCMSAEPEGWGKGHNWVYMVTAKHVIDGIIRDSVDGIVYARVNLKAGGVAIVHSEASDWLTLPDAHPPVDVAALRWIPDVEVFDHMWFPDAGVVDEKRIADLEIGVGNEVFITGLFVNHFGQNRNIPIVRTGTIATMADDEELVHTGLGDIPAYLIEARSIGGLSGSPVFVTPELFKTTNGQLEWRQSGYHLLGLMHGHWKVDLPPDADSVSEEAVNMGIGIVVPATGIRDVVNQQKEKDMRKAVTEEHKAKELPVMDSTEPPTPQSRDEFMRDLRKVTKRIEPESDQAEGEK